MVARPRVTSVSNRPKQASFDSAVLTLWVVQEFPEIQESIFKGHTARVTALFNGDRSFPAAGPRICNSLPVASIMGRNGAACANGKVGGIFLVGGGFWAFEKS